jgi:hypothetical protein
MGMLVAPAKLVILIRRNHGCDVSVVQSQLRLQMLRRLDVYRKSTRHRRTTKRPTLKSDEMT